MNFDTFRKTARSSEFETVRGAVSDALQENSRIEADIQEQSFTLLANAQARFNVGAFKYIFVEDASADFQIAFGSTSLISAHKYKSFDVGAVQSQIILKSTTAQTVKLQFSMSPIRTGKADVTISNVSTTIQGSNTINNTGDATVTNVAASIIAANANRKSVIFYVPSSEDFGVRVGNASVSTSNGILIEPGMTREFFDESQWYAVREASATSNVTLNVLELVRP